MQNNQFLHRAIMPENILVTSKSQGEEVRVADFFNAGVGQSNQIVRNE
jgi:serine/threonine protein kinase